ncbi:MAG: hypothetical protein VX617_01100 [Pseudomonadota bacterium]|nr:hypothetical protein [Pseudomonadota bacterium]
MEPLYLMGSIVGAVGLGLLFGYKFDQSYTLVKWLGAGKGGFWLIWILAFSSVYIGYNYLEELAAPQGAFILTVFLINLKSMRTEQNNESLIESLDELDNACLVKHIEAIKNGGVATISKAKAHNKRLIKALKTANESVIVLSGWKTNYTTKREFRTLLGRCLKRGVMVYIGYGYQKPEEELIESSLKEEAKGNLNKLLDWCMNRNWEGRLEVIYLPNHAKILIKDDDYAIMGNFDWLSNSNLGNYNEKSWIVSNKEFINEEKDQIVMGY